MEHFSHKRGDTLSCFFEGAIEEVDPLTGVFSPVTDFTGWQVAAQIRGPNNDLIETLTTSFVDPANSNVVALGPTQANWPIGPVYMDIEYTTPASQIQSTETICIKIIQDITNANIL